MGKERREAQPGPSNAQESEIKRLREAVSVVWETSKDAAIKGIHGRYFSVLSESHFRAILKNPSKLLKASPDIKRAFLEFAKLKGSVLAGSKLTLYEAMRWKLEVDNQEHLASYVGLYRCFRMSDESTALVEGTIEILNNTEGVFWFEHKSMQNLRIIGTAEFNHDGPVYIRSKRIYLVGIGKDKFGSYIRPIIIGTVDEPREQMMVGMVLTETAYHVPMACKTVLVHEELFRNLGAASAPDVCEAAIKRLLKNESDIDDILYGWGEDS